MRIVALLVEMLVEYFRWNANALVNGAKAPRFVAHRTTAEIFLHTTLHT